MPSPDETEVIVSETRFFVIRLKGNPGDARNEAHAACQNGNMDHWLKQQGRKLVARYQPSYPDLEYRVEAAYWADRDPTPVPASEPPQMHWQPHGPGCSIMAPGPVPGLAQGHMPDYSDSSPDPGECPGPGWTLKSGFWAPPEGKVPTTPRPRKGHWRNNNGHWAAVHPGLECSDSCEHAVSGDRTYKPALRDGPREISDEEFDRLRGVGQ